MRVAALVLLAACGRVDFDVATRFRKLLVIDHAQVAGELADFPVLVELHDADLSAHARADGFDLTFRDASGQVLAYERENYTASPPALVAWVKVPQVSAAADTRRELDYGDPAATDQAQPAAVWSNAFVGVYHFGDGTNLSAHDSTGVNDGTDNGGIASADAVIGGALRLDNTGNTTHNVTSPLAGADATAGALTTVTFWLEFPGPFDKGPFAFTSGSNAYDVWFQRNGCEGFNTQQGELLGMTATVDPSWHHVAVVFYNGVPDASHNRIYLDGVSQVLSPCVAGTPSTRVVQGLANWGGNSSGGVNYQITGAIDEGHIARGERPPEWILTEIANQRSPETFVTAGPEQPAP
ncbi:MAG: DUF2341 domain-containing protein [Acidobacteriota bacterium]